MKDEWTDCRQAAPDRSDGHAVDTCSPRCAQPGHSQNQLRQRYAVRFKRARTHLVRPRAMVGGAGILSGLRSLRSHGGSDISKMPIELIRA